LCLSQTWPNVKIKENTQEESDNNSNPRSFFIQLRCGSEIQIKPTNIKDMAQYKAENTIGKEGGAFRLKSD